MPDRAVGALAPLQSGVSIPQQTTGTYVFALVLIAALAAALLFLHYRNRYVGLPTANTEHKAALSGSKASQTPESLRIPADADPERYRDSIRTLITRALERARDGRRSSPETDRMTVPQAVGNVSTSAATGVAPIVARISRPVRRIAGLGVLTAIFGAIAVSTGAVIELLESGGGAGEADHLVPLVRDLSSQFATWSLDLLTAFPHVDLVWSLGFTVIVLGAEWLWTHWYVTASLLLVGAVTIAVLERWKLRDYDATLYDRRSLVIVLAKRLALIWGVGVGIAVPLSAAGAPEFGPLLGFLAAALAAVAILVIATIRFCKRVLDAAAVAWPFGGAADPRTVRDIFVRRGIRMDHDPVDAADGLADRLDAVDSSWRGPDPDPALAAYLMVRRLLVAASVLIAPFPLGYFVVSVGEGRLWRVLWAAVTAPAETKLLLATCLGVPLALLAWLARDSWPDVRAGLVEAWARKRVRLALLQRGVSYAAVSFVFMFMYAMVRSLPVALIAAIIVGFVTYWLSATLVRAKYDLDLFGTRDRVPRSPLVQVYALEDADGDYHPLVVLGGGDALSLSDPDALADEAVVAVAQYSAEGRVEPSFATWRADDLLAFGIVDPAETRGRVREKVRKVVFDELRDAGERDEPDLWDDLDQFPESTATNRLETFERKNLIYRADGTVYLRRDPWRQDGAV